MGNFVLRISHAEWLMEKTKTRMQFAPSASCEGVTVGSLVTIQVNFGVLAREVGTARVAKISLGEITLSDFQPARDGW